MRAATFVAILLLRGLASVSAAGGQPPESPGPETVVVPSGSLHLTALLWRPSGSGPFPAVLFCHGSGPTEPSRARVLGPVFARHGYAFLYLFRRGDGLSSNQGRFLGDLLERERSAKGEEARKELQLRLLTTDHLDDTAAGVTFLRRALDPGRVAVVGHSFGGQLALLMAERDGALCAAVAFAPAAASWDGSPELRRRLLEAARGTDAPVSIAFAANDYSTRPGEVLAAERGRLAKVTELKIYPPVGRTPEEGHPAVYRAIPRWEEDVFGFLDRHV